jgi:hypothetical protein
MKYHHEQLDRAFTDFWLRVQFEHIYPLARVSSEHIACEYYIAFSFAFDKADRRILDEFLSQKKPLPEEFLPLLTLLMDGVKRRGGPLPKFSTAERRNIFFLMIQDQVKTKKKIEELVAEFVEKIKENTSNEINEVSVRRIWNEFKKESWAVKFLANNHNST